MAKINLLPWREERRALQKREFLNAMAAGVLVTLLIFVVVHLFDELPRVTPDGVFLSKFTQVAADITFEGKSQSNARVSAFMRSIEASQWLQAPSLSVIQTPDKANLEQLSDFTLHAKQGNKNTDVANGGGK